MSPDYKNVIFISFLFHPNVSTKSAGLPDFCSVNLDGKGLVQKPFFHVVGSLRNTCMYMEPIGQIVSSLSMGLKMPCPPSLPPSWPTGEEPRSPDDICRKLPTGTLALIVRWPCAYLTWRHVTLISCHPWILLPHPITAYRAARQAVALIWAPFTSGSQKEAVRVNGRWSTKRECILSWSNFNVIRCDRHRVGDMVLGLELYRRALRLEILPLCPT